MTYPPGTVINARQPMEFYHLDSNNVVWLKGVFRVVEPETDTTWAVVEDEDGIRYALIREEKNDET